jgi:hypothetical protein
MVMYEIALALAEYQLPLQVALDITDHFLNFVRARACFRDNWINDPSVCAQVNKTADNDVHLALQSVKERMMLYSYSACSLSFVLCTVSLLCSLKNYRKNMLNAYRSVAFFSML